ncbi:hypothetical protein [Hymenobacter sp. BT190]|nr:hypothetical protein [Hymenobacter sp. BT190]MBC6698086.1 hypothetical protein [Hymenobacter sp. BT190]
MKTRLLILIGALLLSSCITHSPTVAGTTAKKGMNNVPIVKREKRHF